VREKVVRSRTRRPVLSVVIPTFNRPEATALCVASIADQIDEDLEDRVEIVLSDNASEAPMQATIRDLAARYPSISYYLNAHNGGMEVQVLTAPWRAQGEWMWLFGDDDLLAPGGLAHVVRRLETDAPDFLTLNRCIVDNALKQVIHASKHTIDSQDFDNIIDLVGVVGMDQLSFITSQVYRTDVARSIVPDDYLHRDSFYAQLAYYLEGFHSRRSSYDREVYVIHRWQPDDNQKHEANFYHLALTLPRVIAEARDRAGLPPDLMERLSGVKFAGRQETPAGTYVDNVLRYLWLCVAQKYPITEDDWRVLETEAGHWRAGRAACVREARETANAIAATLREHQSVSAELETARKNTSIPASLRRLSQASLALRVETLAKDHDALCRKALATADQFA
jgi:glycosyltransferase involved in cell wall biosynthesis